MTPAQLADELARIDKLDRLAKRAAAEFHRAQNERAQNETPHYSDMRNGSLMHSEVPQWVWNPPAWLYVLAVAMAVGIVAAIAKAVMWWI